MIASVNRLPDGGGAVSPTKALPPSERRARRLLGLGTALALVVPVVLASTLPLSESDDAVHGITVLGVGGGISSAIAAGKLHARHLKAKGMEMSVASITLWVAVGVALALFLGYFTFGIYVLRGWEPGDFPGPMPS